MDKNETGLKVLERGDVVRIGQGKVLYTVLSDEFAGLVHIESQNTGKASTVDAGRLTLVRNVRTLPETPAEDEGGGSETGGNRDEYKAARSVAFGHLIKAEHFDNSDQSHTIERGSYSKLLLSALQILPAIYAGTVSDKVKARRRAKNKVARASRKANR